ncbi:MAG: cobalamin B12-binding domain-containing protein [Nocardioides sp.]
MRRLVDDGWSPAAAVAAVRNGDVPPVPEELGGGEGAADVDRPDAATYQQQFVGSAARMDTAGLEESLDGGFALGSFEHVVDTWLFPTLAALGESWARGEVDVAGEHAASHAVHRRLSAAFDAAGSRSRGPAVVVGLPAGSQHELGALAFATAIRRRGLDVLYLGANVPVSSWETASRSHAARAAVLAVVTAKDRAAAVTVARRLMNNDLVPLVCSGGAAGDELAPGVRDLPPRIGAAAELLDQLIDSTHT